MPFIPPPSEELMEGLRRYAGIAEANSRGENLSRRLSQIADKVLSVIDPRSLLKGTPLTRSDARTLSGKDVSIASRKLCSMAATMHQGAFMYGFALTLGDQLDELVARAQRSSLAEALVLDAAGSFLVEHYAGLLEESLEKDLSRQGLLLSASFSPGYCDWDLRQGQEELFRFLSPQDIGIDLHDSGMMSPVKSMTGIFVASPEMPERTPCGFCLKGECPHRR